MGRKIKELSGLLFGRLTAISCVGRDRRGYALWECLCECGNSATVVSYSLIRGNTKSCGCFQRECASAAQTTHGRSGTPLYSAWRNARERVTNQEGEKWSDYGGRGITMCQEWLDSFENFVLDMGETWATGLSLDRIDVNGNYCPENCRWVPLFVQPHNKRKLKGCSSQYKGVCLNKEKGKFEAYITFDHKRECLGSFSSEINAAIAHDNRSEELYGDRPNGTENNKGEIKC